MPLSIVTFACEQAVQFDQAFMYAYSLRERTHAAYKLSDDVPAVIKQRRLQEIIAAFHAGALQRNLSTELDSYRLVLVEGPSRASKQELPLLTGRTDGNKRVVFTGGCEVRACNAYTLMCGCVAHHALDRSSVMLCAVVLLPAPDAVVLVI